MTRLEQETIINFNEAEATATIYTHNAALCRKLEALADQRRRKQSGAAASRTAGGNTPFPNAG